MLRGRGKVGRDMLDDTALASVMSEGGQTVPMLIVFKSDVFLSLSHTPFSAYRNPSAADHPPHSVCIIHDALCSHRLVLRNRVFNISSWFIKS